MKTTMRLVAAAALLGALAGCANMGSWMPNWTPNTPADGMQDPPIYQPPAAG